MRASALKDICYRLLRLPPPQLSTINFTAQITTSKISISGKYCTATTTTNTKSAKKIHNIVIMCKPPLQSVLHNRTDFWREVILEKGKRTEGKFASINLCFVEAYTFYPPFIIYCENRAKKRKRLIPQAALQRALASQSLPLII